MADQRRAPVIKTTSMERRKVLQEAPLSCDRLTSILRDILLDFACKNAPIVISNKLEPDCLLVIV